MRIFTRHPESMGETYGQHLHAAVRFGGQMMMAGAACIVHGFLPFAFQRTASRTVTHLHQRMISRRSNPLSHFRAEPMPGAE